MIEKVEITLGLDYSPIKSFKGYFCLYFYFDAIQIVKKCGEC